MSRIALSITIAFSFAGCAAESDSTRGKAVWAVEEARALAAQRHERTPGVVRAMIGLWEVDIEAMMRECSRLSASEREFVRQDLEQYPFTLRITASDYISTSRRKVRADKYTVLAVDAQTVTIQLLSADGPEPESASNREIKLLLRNGQLLIHPAGPFTCVMRPVPPGGG